MQIADQLHAFLWRSAGINNCNTYFIDGDARILIDPGHMGLFEHVKANLAQLGLTLSDIDLVLCTHAHPDHVEATLRFRETDALVAMHRADWEMVQRLSASAGLTLGNDIQRFAPDFFLDEGELNVRGIGLQVLHTPGHSPGSVCIYWNRQKALFSGDVVFKEGLGRTDLPGGNGSQLKSSIQKLSSLDVETLLPGHGELLSEAAAVKRNFQHVQEIWFSYI